MTVKMIDLAKHCRVSIATVSNVINNVPTVSEKSRVRVLKAIKDLGYVPNENARKLSMSRRSGGKHVKTHNIGCVVSSGHAFSHWRFTSMLNGVADEVLKQGYHLSFIYSADQMQKYPALFARMFNPDTVDGLILIDTWYGPKFLNEMRARVKNMVALNGSCVGDVDTIDIDRFGIAEKAVDYLAALGHKRIAFIGYVRSMYDKKYDGYYSALMRNGLDTDRALMEGNDYGVENGYNYMKAILERAKPLPTAVFAASDYTAIGAIRAIREKGLGIPGDMSVIGFDDIPEVSYITPPLTTFRVPKEEMGLRGVRQLLERIDNPGMKPVRVTLDAELVERASCAGARSVS